MAAKDKSQELIVKTISPLVNMDDQRMLARAKIAMVARCNCGNCAICASVPELEDFVDRYTDALIELIEKVDDWHVGAFGLLL